MSFPGALTKRPALVRESGSGGGLSCLRPGFERVLRLAAVGIILCCVSAPRAGAQDGEEPDPIRDRIRAILAEAAKGDPPMSWGLVLAQEADRYVTIYKLLDELLRLGSAATPYIGEILMEEYASYGGSLLMMALEEMRDPQSPCHVLWVWNRWQSYRDVLGDDDLLDSFRAKPISGFCNPESVCYRILPRLMTYQDRWCLEQTGHNADAQVAVLLGSRRGMDLLVAHWVNGSSYGVEDYFVRKVELPRSLHPPSGGHGPRIDMELVATYCEWWHANREFAYWDVSKGRFVVNETAKRRNRPVGPRTGEMLPLLPVGASGRAPDLESPGIEAADPGESEVAKRVREILLEIPRRGPEPKYARSPVPRDDPLGRLRDPATSTIVSLGADAVRPLCVFLLKEYDSYRGFQIAFSLADLAEGKALPFLLWAFNRSLALPGRDLVSATYARAIGQLGSYQDRFLLLMAGEHARPGSVLRAEASGALMRLGAREGIELFFTTKLHTYNGYVLGIYREVAGEEPDPHSVIDYYTRELRRWERRTPYAYWDEKKQRFILSEEALWLRTPVHPRTRELLDPFTLRPREEGEPEGSDIEQGESSSGHK